MSARDGLGLLPFSDYADPDPHGQMRLEDEPTDLCASCGLRPWGHGYCGELCSVCAAVTS